MDAIVVEAFVRHHVGLLVKVDLLYRSAAVGKRINCGVVELQIIALCVRRRKMGNPANMRDGFAIGRAREIVTEKVPEDFLGVNVHLEVFAKRRADVTLDGNSVGTGPSDGGNAHTRRTFRRNREGLETFAVEAQDDEGRRTVLVFGALLIVSDAVLSRRKFGLEF